MDSRIEATRRLKVFLDEAFRVPGTRVRFGWDALLGLIPWAGDVLTAALASAIIVQANRVGVPRIVQLRMLLNIGIDLAVGLLPFAGDVADVFWKANSRNFALLERHASSTPPPVRGDWLFVGALLAFLALLAVLPLLLVVWAVRALIDRGLL